MFYFLFFILYFLYIITEKNNQFCLLAKNYFTQMIDYRLCSKPIQIRSETDKSLLQCMCLKKCSE